MVVPRASPTAADVTGGDTGPPGGQDDKPICRVLSEHGIPIAPSTYFAIRMAGSDSRMSLRIWGAATTKRTGMMRAMLSASCGVMRPSSPNGAPW